MTKTFDIVSLNIVSEDDGWRVSYDVPVQSRQAKDGQWIVRCEPFKCLGSSYDSEKAATADLEDDIKVFLLHHLRAGSLDSILVNLGWEKQSIPVAKTSTARRVVKPALIAKRPKASIRVPEVNRLFLQVPRLTPAQLNQSPYVRRSYSIAERVVTK
jgi:hypothetical protein